MPTITISCNVCSKTMESYNPPKSGIQQDDLEALMAAKGVPVDPAELDWNCGCNSEGRPRPSLSWVNFVGVEE